MRSNSNALLQQPARSSRAEAHPGAEVLLAFAQERLLPGESTEVLTHLARCSDCRGALRVATAARPEPVAAPSPTPAAKPVAVVAARPTAARRRVSLHLLDAAVGVIAIGSIMLIYHHRTAKAASGSAAGVASAAVVQKAVTTPPPVKAPAPAHTSAPPATAPPVTATAATAKPVQATPAQIAPTVASTHAGTPPSPSEAQKGLETKSAVVAKPVETAPPTARAAALNLPMAGSDTNRRTAPQAPQAQAESLTQAPDAPSAAAIAVGSAGQQPVTIPPRRTQWRVSGESGLVERSTSEGVWREMPGTGALKMRVVLTVGGAVWAGGDALRLYRSMDGGSVWIPVDLPQKDGASGAIRSIRFQSALDGTVESDDGSAWTTTDGGLTWK
jgi:hypothetical protein